MEQVSHETAEVLLREAEDLLDGRQTASALNAFSQAESAGADADRCAAGRWQAWMLLGDFGAAWQESDAIRQRGGPDPHRFWNGAPLAGKRVVVRCLHGLGDAVQMLRFLPLLRAQAAELFVEVPPRLLELAPLFDGAERVITWGEQAPDCPLAWDVQIEVMELPYVFRTTMADLPAASRYLHLPLAAVEQTAQRMQAVNAPVEARRVRRVGIVWSASEWDPTRCLPPACLAALAGVPGIEFWNLQGGAPHDDATYMQALDKACDAAAIGEGLLPLATVIANLDLVITVDTLAAHLAGALGRPAWVLLQHRADWRWMQDCEHSPWYPTLRLFRQPVQDDWGTLTGRVCKELEHWQAQQH